MGAVMRSHDWQSSQFGPLATWPQELRSAVALCLGARDAIGIYWGKEFLLLYNDAFRDMIGNKHPHALGRPGAEVFPEIWDRVGPILGEVRASGAAAEDHDALMPLNAGDGLEDRWFDFTMNPIVGDDGQVSGIFNIAVETTSRIVAQRNSAEAERRLKEGATAARLSTDFKALFEASPTPFLVIAPPDWTIIAANDARLQLTALTREDQIGRPLFEVFPDDPEDPLADGVRNLRASLDRVMATKAADTMAVQRYAVRDLEGLFVERWWSPINVPVLGVDDDVALVIHRVEEVTDIVRLRGKADAQDQLIRDQHGLIQRLRETESALRESDQHLRLMVNELNHRVKNTLATVQSIVAQTLREHEGPGGADAITSRLIALSRAHDMLTDEHWAGADLHEIIKATTDPYRLHDQSRVEIKGPELKTPPRLALTLALAFHELATNAVKYGALSDQDGRVRITWSLTKAGDRTRLDLMWRETGGPAVTEPTRRGFGTRLIERSLAAEADGHAELTFDPRGLQCRLVADVSEERVLNL